MASTTWSRIVDAINSKLTAPFNYVAGAIVRDISQSCNVSIDDVANVLCVKYAKQLAVTPISNFHVSFLCSTKSGVQNRG